MRIAVGAAAVAMYRQQLHGVYWFAGVGAVGLYLAPALWKPWGLHRMVATRQSAVRRWFVLIAVVLGVVSVAGGLVVAERHTQSTQTSAAAPRIHYVKTIAVASAPFGRVLSLPATVRAFYMARLYTKASGYVDSVLVDIGDRVKAGQLLAVISEPELQQQYVESQAKAQAAQAAVVEAEATVEQSRKKLQVAQSQLASTQAALNLQQSMYKRSKELFAGKAISDQSFDEASKQYQSAIADQAAAAATGSANKSGVGPCRIIPNGICTTKTWVMTMKYRVTPEKLADPRNSGSRAGGR